MFAKMQEIGGASKMGITRRRRHPQPRGRGLACFNADAAAASDISEGRHGEKGALLLLPLNCFCF